MLSKHFRTSKCKILFSCLMDAWSEQQLQKGRVHHVNISDLFNKGKILFVEVIFCATKVITFIILALTIVRTH